MKPVFLKKRANMAPMATAVLLAAVSSADAAWTILETFDSYDNSTVTTIGANGAGDVTNGTWDGIFDGTGNANVYDDGATNQVLEVWGIPSQGAGGWRGAVTDLSTAYGSDYTIAGGTTATIFFQFREVSATGGSYDVMMGLAENVSDIDNSNSWQDFEVMPYLAGGGPGVADLNSTGGTAIVDPAADAWYNVWLVVNNTAKTYDIYTSTGTANGTLQVTGATFVGSGATTGDLKAFALSNGQDGHLQIDNLAIDLSGSNTTFIPEPSISLLGGLGLLGLLRRRRA